MADAETMPLQIPAELDGPGAALWVQTGLMNAAIARKWNRAELRAVLLTLVAGFAIHDCHERKLRREFDEALALAQARRTPRRN